MPYFYTEGITPDDHISCDILPYPSLEKRVQIMGREYGHPFKLEWDSRLHEDLADFCRYGDELEHGEEVIEPTDAIDFVTSITISEAQRLFRMRAERPDQILLFFRSLSGERPFPDSEQESVLRRAGFLPKGMSYDEWLGSTADICIQQDKIKLFVANLLWSVQLNEFEKMTKAVN